MIATLKSGLGRLRADGAKLPPLPPSFFKRLAPIVVLAIGITALVLMYFWRDQAGYKPVFGARESISAADMMSVLDAEHVPYRIHPESGQVLVPADALGKARMLLAAKGVVAKLPAGLELMDKNDPLGVSQFVQDVRFRRGLEGELVQSIMALNEVEHARVHLSIAKSSSFVVSDGEKSSASVVVTLKPGAKLGREQIAAIINLVAGSVASLDPQRVTLVDQAGNYLSSKVDLSEGGAVGAASGEEAGDKYRTEALNNIRELLAPALGGDNYKASVTAEVDTDRVEETREQYGETPKVTNEATRDEQSSSELAMGIPGSLSNRPAAANASKPQAAGGDAGPRKNATTRQYAYDRNVVQIKRSRDRLKRLNVAVVLNNAAAPVPAKGWTPEQLANIDRILRNGLGIDAERGDKLVVSTLAFPAKPVLARWWEERDTMIDIGSYAIQGVVLLLVFLLVIRPLLKILRDWVSPAHGEQALREVQLAEPQLLAAAAAGAAPVAAAATALPDRSAGAGQMPVVPLLENYDLPPAGSSVDVLVDHLKTLANKEPERVAEVVKQWVQKNGRVS
ncbi:flagellar basal-body MS-ring/collar protein FliF [Jeongeupia naejangsanensis]|uniref:Flagellar M-ring protein n=1 Tax=Jeongeupia naejangsanensis TaxID=613195 RepID=A0ABS2BGJ0_9NEIS|nr:flagellar basal-body MS-ring/collar protein FliF [Jeongeupia naejangsanensis]MBM3114721.1 flagellar M-ring protein FliF [Jeongeupia naejangsanensis]